MIIFIASSQPENECIFYLRRRKTYQLVDLNIPADDKMKVKENEKKKQEIPGSCLRAENFGNMKITPI